MKKNTRFRPIRSRNLFLHGLLLAITLIPGSLALGQEVKIVDPMTVVRSLEDFRQAEALDTVRLVGPRGGFVSGQVLVAPEAAPLAEATVTDFSGPAAMSADAVQLRYATMGPARRLMHTVSAASSDMTVNKPYHDVLHTSPPSEAEIVPVWVTVQIPPDAQEGTYTATLTVAGKRVPVRLEVCSWRCPPPREWVGHAGMLWSPETLAMHYGVALWSPEHWKLLEQELQWLGGLGNDDLWISIFPRNSLGQETPWITFTNNGDSIEPDLAVLKKYLALYARHVGPPHAIILEMWNSVRYPTQRNQNQAPDMQILVDGQWQTVPLPGEEGSEAVWPAVLAGIRQLVREVGWDESTIMIGCADDIRPDDEAVDFFETHAPGATWAIWTHGRGDPKAVQGKLLLEGLEIGHYEHVFCPWLGKERDSGIVGGWDLVYPEFGTSRNYLPTYIRLSQYRSFAEGNVVDIGRASVNMARSSAGFTRLPLDFWPVDIQGARGTITRSLLFAYEREPWSTLFRNNTRSIIEPGPDGPLGTARYEMLREGMQECEARIAIEKALQAGRLGGGLEQRCRQLLRRRLQVREKNATFKGGHSGNTLGTEDRLWGVAPNWQDMTAELFNLAGQVD
ncbi:MAG: glycoside hydrolase domain-containing protein [Planctomycetota bacterium]|jgi:hypothetical protein